MVVVTGIGPLIGWPNVVGHCLLVAIPGACRTHLDRVAAHYGRDAVFRLRCAAAMVLAPGLAGDAGAVIGPARTV